VVSSRRDTGRGFAFVLALLIFDGLRQFGEFQDFPGERRAPKTDTLSVSAGAAAGLA
jgi:hypothetical protein